MIKPVTFQGAENFKANLYALEVRSRFVDQSAANGYYAGYGNELAATVSSNVISIGTGAFLVQGRLIEVETAESLSVVIQNGKYGLVIARIETYPAANTANCSLVVRTGNSISSLLSGLTQENTYQHAAEMTNKVYELPLYSFYMTVGEITITEKVISEIKEITEIKQKADTAKSTAETAAATASEAAGEASVARVIAQSMPTTIYPVGAVYISVSNTSPASLFGGTWASFGEGRALVGINSGDSDFNTVEKTGGEKTHLLTEAETPTHTHVAKGNYKDSGLSTFNLFATPNSDSSGHRISVRCFSSGAFTTGYVYENSTAYLRTGEYGSGGVHNNLQPYITVYMWKRVS